MAAASASASAPAPACASVASSRAAASATMVESEEPSIKIQPAVEQLVFPPLVLPARSVYLFSMQMLRQFAYPETVAMIVAMTPVLA